jgi:hypothetical protein
MYAHAGKRKVDEQDDEGFDVLAENGGSSSFLSSVDRLGQSPCFATEQVSVNRDLMSHPVLNTPYLLGMPHNELTWLKFTFAKHAYMKRNRRIAGLNF